MVRELAYFTLGELKRLLRRGAEWNDQAGQHQQGVRFGGDGYGCRAERLTPILVGPEQNHAASMRIGYQGNPSIPAPLELSHVQGGHCGHFGHGVTPAARQCPFASWVMLTPH